MNLPLIRNFPGYAKFAVAVYVFLVFSIFVVALSLAAVHMGISGKQSSSKTATESSGGSEVMDGQDQDSSESGVSVIDEEPKKDDENVIKTPWFVYDNFKIGHAHLNGQTMLLFTIVVPFLLTAASPGMKKSMTLILAVSVIFHTFGMFYQHKELFNIILRASGGLYSLVSAVMCLYILKEVITKNENTP